MCKNKLIGLWCICCIKWHFLFEIIKNTTTMLLKNVHNTLLNRFLIDTIWCFLKWSHSETICTVHESDITGESSIEDRLLHFRMNQPTILPKYCQKLIVCVRRHVGSGFTHFCSEAVICITLSPSTLISTIHPHHELHLHTLEIPHYVRQCLPVQNLQPMQHRYIQKWVHLLSQKSVNNFRNFGS